MPTLNEQYPSLILEHEAKLREAFRRFAPDQEQIIDVIKKFGDLRPDVLVKAEQSWRRLAREFTDVKKECEKAPQVLAERWYGTAFTNFKKFVHTGDTSIQKTAKKLAEKTTAIADGLRDTNEYYRVTWMELRDSTAAVIGGLAGGVAGALLGSVALPGPGTVAGAAIGAALGALVPIVVQSGLDGLKAANDFNNALDDFVEFVPNKLNLPLGDLTNSTWKRDSNQVIDR